jgi:non-lysosomal glucosylceramidase
VVAYNSVLHLAAMQAAAKLADVEGDADFVRACREAFSTGEKRLDQLLWTGSYYRSWWMEHSGQTDALHVDTLYGQLWASLLGLGWVVEPDKARLHLQAEMRLNQSPFGLKVMHRRGQDRKPSTDDRVWQAGTFDWAALNLLLGGDVKTSLAEAEEVINNWREHLHDQWDWTDTTFSHDGQPSCNSHYARQLIFWSIPLALSGQQYSAPEKRLSFDPRPDAPPRLPWLIPRANGLLERLADGSYRMTVLSGKVALDELRVADALPVRNAVLQAGESVDLPPGK